MSSPPMNPEPQLAQVADDVDDQPVAGRRRRSRPLAQLAQLTLAVADADAAEIAAAARRLGESRRYLAPLAWAAGAIVLLIRGVKLLFLNWRLTLVELVPAAWIWLVMYDLKQHTLRGEPFRHLTVGGLILAAVLTITASIASFWCNTVFAFAISDPPPRIAPAARQTNRYLGRILIAGTVMGIILAFGAIGIPRIGSKWLFAISLGGLYAVMLITFVAIPANILGMKKKQKLPPRQMIGRWTVSGALSAVAMTPGFLLDRLGLILLGVPGFKILGFVLLSIGTALYAAGMSSVRAVKLTMKLDRPS